MELNLNNKTALITGASKGIGKAIAESMASEGCNLILTARSEDKLIAVKSDLQKRYNISVGIIAIDLSLKGAAEKVTEFSGDIDILINNAGAIPPGNILDINEDIWRESWDLKVFGYINLTRAIYSKMKTIKKGVILMFRTTVVGAPSERWQLSE